MDLSDAKVAEEEDDEGFMCASVAHCPKAKIASKARENKISGDAKDAGEVARPEADLSCPARKDEVVGDIEAAAAAQPEPVQLLDLSTTEEEETASNFKSAAQVFMEEKVEKIKAKQKMGAKLALLKREVKLGQQLLQQTKTLLKGKEALVQRKVRVTYNRCHKFWRGQVILAHKADVEKQVDAAKKRLGVWKSGIKFNISAMVQYFAAKPTEDEVARDSGATCSLQVFSFSMV